MQTIISLKQNPSCNLFFPSYTCRHSTCTLSSVGNLYIRQLFKKPYSSYLLIDFQCSQRSFYYCDIFRQKSKNTSFSRTKLIRNLPLNCGQQGRQQQFGALDKVFGGALLLCSQFHCQCIDILTKNVITLSKQFFYVNNAIAHQNTQKKMKK